MSNKKDVSLRKLLVIEDDLGLQSQLKWCFDDFEVLIAKDRREGIAALRRFEPAVVLLDLGLPPDPENATEGLLALDEILSISPDTKVIIVTGSNDRENALLAIQNGAYDFYHKPVDSDVIRLIVERAFNLHSIEKENASLLHKQSLSVLPDIVASSPEMLGTCKMVEKVAPTDITILLSGESGTGKELFAKALHELSPRGSENFVAINCAAIPENLLESELFGHEKGAFTSAVKQTKGKIECADGGTLFLDEIGDLPMSLQAKLLRFLQERVIERIGGREEIPVDIRVICATHQDVKNLIKEGSFREDLYYRIGEITIPIPPLRERSGDIVLLARYFLKKYKAKLNKRVTGFSADAISAMEQYPWPGNVREMENKLKRAIVMAEEKLISANDLELQVSEDDSSSLNLRYVREEAERKALIRALNLADNNMSKTAEVLGISRPTLYDLLNKHGLKPEVRDQNTGD
jgi:two-component system NtrC family response regulator